MDGSNLKKRQSKSTGLKLNLGAYKLEDQIGFIIRKAGQRHAATFMSLMIEELTPTQWAALVKVAALGVVSQNQLGRDTAMDVSTIKGVVDRLIKRGFLTTSPDLTDVRRNVIAITAKGEILVKDALPIAAKISEATMESLSLGEKQILMELLRKIA